MRFIKVFGLASAMGVAAIAPSSASATTFLYDFQLDALNEYGATNIVYSADNLDPTNLTYVSGNVNGATSAVLSRKVYGPTNRGFSFLSYPSDSEPAETVVDMFFSVSFPFSVGQTYETISAGRGISNGKGGVSYLYTNGRLTISELSAAVPEPATWITILLGFGLLGMAMRRHSTVRTTVSYA
jgi:hypothetical protein